MSAVRFAGPALKAFIQGAKELVPQGKLAKAMTFGPDILFAGASAMAAPEGTSPLERLGIGAYDALAFGLLPSFAGRALGRAGARRLAGMTNPEDIERAMGVTEMGAQMAPVLLGMQNPLLNAAFEKQAQSQQELAQRQQEDEERRKDELLLGSLAMGGGLAASTLSPRSAADAGADLFGYGGLLG